MKVEIVKSDLIKLIPETDADSALLYLWTDSQHRPRIASHEYENSKTTALTIEFVKEKDTPEK